MELTDQVVIKAKSFDDAKSKLSKFVKRGAVDRCNWPDSTLLDWERYSCIYVTVYHDGTATMHNHDCQPAVVLKRVRDVENYRV